MIKTVSTTTTSTSTTVGAIKKFATAAAMMGALGLGALGAAGAAAAAPAHHPSPNTSASSENAGPKKGDDVVHAHFIPGFKPVTPPATQEPVIPAHFIPGFKPVTPPATGVQSSKMPAPFVPGYPIDPPLGAPNSGRTLGSLPPLPGFDPNHKDCEACEEVIDE
jgi:hypothetical protein